MPPRRKNEKLRQLIEFERGKIISLREERFSYRAIAASVQRNSSTVMRVWKQWTNEQWKTRKSGSGRRKQNSACDDRHLLRMAANDRTASFRQLADRWFTSTGVLTSVSSIRRHLLHCGLCLSVLLNSILLKGNYR